METNNNSGRTTVTCDGTQEITVKLISKVFSPALIQIYIGVRKLRNAILENIV
jgi:hypothetical protein